MENKSKEVVERNNFTSKPYFSYFNNKWHSNKTFTHSGPQPNASQKLSIIRRRGTVPIDLTRNKNMKR